MSIEQQSILFTVRVWRERVGDKRTEMRGKVQHVLTGETRYFRDWQTLHSFVTGNLGEWDDTFNRE